MADRVLVTGGTGKTGKLVAEQLAIRGIEARVATRHAAAPGQVRLEWGDVASYPDALDGVDAIYLVAPTDRTEHLAVMRPMLEQALARGVERMVLLSASSLEEGDEMMGEVHAWLHQNAPRWTVLRPSWFLQNFVTQHLQSILDEGCIYSATGDGRVPFIDAADIAAVAVEALTDPEFEPGERILTGPEALSYDEAAELISVAAGRPVTHSRLTAAELARRYTGFGLPAHYARLLADMEAAISHGAEDRTTAAVERATGRKPASMIGFLYAHLEEFHRPRTH